MKLHTAFIWGVTCLIVSHFTAELYWMDAMFFVAGMGLLLQSHIGSAYVTEQRFKDLEQRVAELCKTM